MKPVNFLPAAAKQWTKLTAEVRLRLDSRLTEFAETGKGDVKRLKGREGARLRVGDWRIIFYEEDEAIFIVAVGHRRDIYD